MTLDWSNECLVLSVGIHEHCTAAEILVFGRETISHLNIAEVVYVQVTPSNRNKLDFVL
jgi:hypothetical protein